MGKRIEPIYIDESMKEYLPPMQVCKGKRYYTNEGILTGELQSTTKIPLGTCSEFREIMEQNETCLFDPLSGREFNIDGTPVTKRASVYNDLYFIRRCLSRPFNGEVLHISREEYIKKYLNRDIKKYNTQGVDAFGYLHLEHNERYVRADGYVTGFLKPTDDEEFNFYDPIFGIAYNKNATLHEYYRNYFYDNNSNECLSNVNIVGKYVV